MKNLLKYSVLAVSIGLATACSGGGGGGNNDKSNPAYDKKEVNTNTKVPSSTYVRDDLKAEVRLAKEMRIFDPANNQTVKMMQLSDYPEGVIKDTFKTSNTDTSYVRVLNLPYSNAITLHTNETGEIAYSAFYGGHVTKMADLPKGTATYQGSSLRLNTSGSLTLTTDFDRKKVTGKIHNRHHDNGNTLNDIVLESAPIRSKTIVSNNTNESRIAAHFEGYTTSGGRTGEYRGTFAGPNAEEVVGLVADASENPYEGFVGKKQ